MSFRASQLSEQEQMFLRQLSNALPVLTRRIFRAKILGMRPDEIAFIFSMSQRQVYRHLKKVEDEMSKMAPNTHSYIEGQGYGDL